MTRLMALAGVLALTIACSNEEPSTAQEEMSSGDETMAEAPAQPDIVDTAQAAGQFQTLLAAVEAAGLVDTLRGEGPYTVFAPTDDAFAALPEGTVESLLLPENRDQLTAVLTYHVVPGAVMAAEVINLDAAETVQGSSLAIAADDTGVRVGNANVIQADVEAANGVIHIIDQVLLPPES